MHRIHLPDPEIPFESGQIVRITGDQAHHAARVKRLAVGDMFEAFDGKGRAARARIKAIEKLGKKEGWAIMATLEQVRSCRPESPRVVIRSAVPKGPRLETMIEQLSQIGIAGWGPLLTERAVVDPREGKLARLVRTAEESAKQCGRDWVISIESRLTLRQVIEQGGRLVVADRSGEPYAGTGCASLTLLVGPEGGWTRGELDRLVQAGAVVANFGRHTLRIESAAVAAGAIVMDQEQRLTPDAGTRSGEGNA
ncbi:MAG TPA: 16S rRNA (uracil(1498)-N(3))-methyltransferase [Phycisphaerales bacterium]|nr:16S rRNA (uracil(1498)-N(3))-methyltransferase [Phycisphaerales bacterium]